MPFFLLTFLTPLESQCAVDRLLKKLVYIFLRMIDINDKFNVYSTSATIMSDILKTIYMKQKQNETILGW